MKEELLLEVLKFRKAQYDKGMYTDLLTVLFTALDNYNEDRPFIYKSDIMEFLEEMVDKVYNS